LHTAQLMPLPLTVSCFSKIQLVLPFWCRLTLVVSEKCVCVVYLYEINAKLQVVATNKLDHKPSESPCSKYRNEIPSRRPQHRRLHGSRLGLVCLFIYLLITPPPMGERSIAMSVSVCLSVRDYIFGTTRPIFAKFFRACCTWLWLGPALAT